MLGLLMVLLSGVAAWRMGDFENRTPWPWALGALLAAFFLPGAMGNWGVLSPVVSLAGVFAGLWWMRARDDRRDGDQPPRSRIVR
jgi:hypothetical protein